MYFSITYFIEKYLKKLDFNFRLFQLFLILLLLLILPTAPKTWGIIPPAGKNATEGILAIT